MQRTHARPTPKIDKGAKVFFCLEVVVGILFFVLPKTTLTVSLLLVGLVAFSIYPILNVARHTLIRVILLVTTCCIAVVLWIKLPHTDREIALTPSQQPSSQQPVAQISSSSKQSAPADVSPPPKQPVHKSSQTQQQSSTNGPNVQQQSFGPKSANVSAPNGFAITGGSVINPTVNNYGTEPPEIKGERVPPDVQGDGKRPIDTVRIYTDRSWPDAIFVVSCSIPCEAFRIGQVSGGGMGTNFRPGSFAEQPPNSAVFDITSPNPFPSATYLTLTVQSKDERPVAITSVSPVKALSKKPH